MGQGGEAVGEGWGKPHRDARAGMCRGDLAGRAGRGAGPGGTRPAVRAWPGSGWREGRAGGGDTEESRWWEARRKEFRGGAPGWGQLRPRTAVWPGRGPRRLQGRQEGERSEPRKKGLSTPTPTRRKAARVHPQGLLTVTLGTWAQDATLSYRHGAEEGKTHSQNLLGTQRSPPDS